MGWLSRKGNVGVLKSDIKKVHALPLDQQKRLAFELKDFIEEIGPGQNDASLVMQTPDHVSERKRLFQNHSAKRRALVSGGFSAQWAHHALRESYLLALIKAPDDHKLFEEVHSLLWGFILAMPEFF